MAFFRYGDKNVYYEKIGAGLPVDKKNLERASEREPKP